MEERDEKGRFLSKPSYITPFNSDTGRAAAKKRWEMVKQAADEALMSHPDARSPVDGLKVIFQAQQELATNPEAGSAATGAARFIVEKGGYDVPKEGGSGATMSIEINSEKVADALARRITGED